jgi:hypothetical protein
VDGETCHDAAMSKVSTEESLRQLAADGDAVARASVGEQYHCRLRRKPVPPQVVFQSKLKMVGMSQHSHGGGTGSQITHIAIGVPTSTSGGAGCTRWIQFAHVSSRRLVSTLEPPRLNVISWFQNLLSNG